MDLVTAMRARIRAKSWPGALLVLALAAGPALVRAQPASDQPPALNGAPSFEVLSVTTGAGSRRQENKQGLRLEILDLTPKSPAEAAEAARALAEADPSLTPAQREAKARAAALETALEQWHSRTIGEYNRDISGLRDPFMPIREVRGQPGPADFSDAGDTASPLLRLELNQLRLVAITTRSGSSGAGGALASFEDEAGISYILRLGDRIGRRRGRITDITENTVTVEEPPSPGAPARVTEIKLGGLYTGGRPAPGGQDDEGLPAGTSAREGQATPEETEAYWLSILSNL